MLSALRRDHAVYRFRIFNWRSGSPLINSPADAVPTVAGSHMTLFRPAPLRIPGEHGSTPGEVSQIDDIIVHELRTQTSIRNAKTVEKMKILAISWYANHATLGITLIVLTLRLLTNRITIGTVQGALSVMASSDSKRVASIP